MRDSLSEQLNRIEAKVDLVLDLDRQILVKENVMSAELDVLTAQVQKNTDVEESAIVLIKGLADQIATLKDDPVKLQALSDQLKGEADKLAAAVTANTPPPPLPVPPPVTGPKSAAQPKKP